MDGPGLTGSSGVQQTGRAMGIARNTDQAAEQEKRQDMHTDYRNPMMRQLRDQQVRFAPREKKIEQIQRAEKLLGEIHLDRTYTYEYLCFRVTDYRPEASPNTLISGKDAGHDLRFFIEDVSDAANIPVESAEEQVLTPNQLSQRFNVSTKTILRWRDHGLTGRRFVVQGRKRVGFLKSTVERFVSTNQERIQRGERFRPISDDERSEIIRRARRMAAAGGCPSEVARRIAERMNRSVESIRYTIKGFDEQHPELAVFAGQRSRLNDQRKQQIYQQYRRGTSVEVLAKRHRRSRTSIYRIVNEIRVEQISELPLDYMDNDCFRKSGMEQEILGQLPEAESSTRRSKPPTGLPTYLATLYEVPLLTRGQEQHLFRRLNYLKYLANHLRQQIDPLHPKSSLMDKIERLYNQAVATKNQIVQANLRLVVSIAKRHVGATSDDFFELVSDGNMSLIRAVEKFDYARGNKFSTYASWAIMKNFARTIPNTYKHRDRYRTSQDEMFALTEEYRSDQIELEQAQQLRERQVSTILSRLDEREQKIIINRFGLDYSQEPQTLKEVGAVIGVTKERVRQLEARALSKLRLAVQDEKIEPPGEEPLHRGIYCRIGTAFSHNESDS